MTVLAISLSVSACGSHYGAANIVSEPTGATVINPIDDSVLGVTPVTITWKESSDERKHIPIRLEKEGFYDKTTSFWLKMTHSRETAAEKKPETIEVPLNKKGA